MNVKEYISSGILELYVAGALTEKENLEIHGHAKEYPEIHSEIQQIEATILELSKISAPAVYQPDHNFDKVMARINVEDTSAVRQLPKKQSNLNVYLGWAASLVLLIGLAWLYNQNTSLQSRINIATQENDVLEKQLLESDNALEASQKILLKLRDKNIASVTALGGQQIAPDSYAKVYWNKEEKTVYIDAMGLPEPPDGMVYQVWSLTNLDPLTPSSIGLLNDFEVTEDKVFTLKNNGEESLGFGITLEPAGGSASPTLEQLYTLGIVAS